MSLTLDVAIDRFADYLVGLVKQSTIIHYGKRLRSFRTALGNKPVKKLKSAKILKHINAVSRWPDGTSKAPDTIRTTIVAWEQLQKWLLESKQIKRRITEPIPKPAGRTMPSHDRRH